MQKTKNNLEIDKPLLSKEWHPFKNGDLKPSDFTIGSHSKVWWLCKKGHEWEAIIKNRVKGNGCPICSGKKILLGFNDLASQKPELLEDWDYDKNGNIKPTEVTCSSNKIVWWKCHICGHEWKTSVGHRTHDRGCPCCSGHVVSKGRNDLATVFPFIADEWDYDRNDIKPDEVTTGSNKKVWWKCPNGHASYLAPIANRSHGAGCPICNTMFQTSFPEQAVYYYIKKTFPDAVSKYKNRNIFKSSMELDIYIPSLKTAIEYDGFSWHNNEKSKIREKKKYSICKANSIYLYRIREKNDCDEDADKVFVVPAFSFYDCSPMNNVIQRIIADTTNKDDIDVNIERDMFDILKYKTIAYKDSLASLYPDVSNEWHPFLNKELKPENVLPGSSLIVWWKCSAGHEWKASIVSRTKGHGCDICAREQRKQTYHKTRLKTRKLLIDCKCIEDWDYEKNEHGPDYYTKGSGEKVWWKCHKCGHEWKTSICDRTRDYRGGCPACSKRTLIKGVNDFATTNPDLLKEWDYLKNGDLMPSDVSQWSHDKVWWRCSKCGYSYQATPGNKTLGRKCGCCAGRVVVPGINDLATTRPDIAIDWHPTKNGKLKPTDVTKGRRNMIWWKCHKCGFEWQDTLNHRNRGRGCSNCNKLSKRK